MKDQNKKIIIAADIFEPDIGGPATYSKKLANILVDRKWQVDLVCYSDSITSDNKYNFSVYRIERSVFRYLKYFFKLLSISKGVDIIYAMGPVSAGLPATLVAKIRRKKLVVKVVGDYAWEQARNNQSTDLGIDDFQKQKFYSKTGVIKWVESFVCKSANSVIVPSKYLKSIVSGWGVDSNNIKVVYNAVEIPYIENTRDMNRIVSIGRLVPWKGFEVLISLMPELIKTNANLTLDIYGGGPEEKKLKKLIDSLDLNDVVSISKLNRDELLEKLSKAGIFVLNTGYEGLPHTVLEAMTLGIPVATTNICGNPEMMMDNGKLNGILFEYNNKEEIKDSILKLLDTSVQTEYINNAKNSLDKFKFEKMINDTENLLLNI